MNKQITLIKPDDWHVHLREGETLKHTVPASEKTFARALVMPNLQRPLTRVTEVMTYYKSLQQIATPLFTPLMTLYLTENTSPAEMLLAKKTNVILSAKLYPAGATTNSEAGIHSLKTLYPVFEMMQQANLVLNIHGESIEPLCDIFDRENYFIQENLIPLIQNFPKLRITLEHISTKCAVDFIQDRSKAGALIAATITPHHLHLNRNHLLVGGIKPHYYCLPILKRRTDQEALILAATSGKPCFFLGTDSAPHAIDQKISACGCAGIYNSPVALPLCASIFENANSLDKLENFTSRFGAEFYQIPQNKTQITLKKQPNLIPKQLALGNKFVVPLCAGETLSWIQFHE